MKSGENLMHKTLEQKTDLYQRTKKAKMGYMVSINPEDGEKVNYKFEGKSAYSS